MAGSFTIGVVQPIMMNWATREIKQVSTSQRLLKGDKSIRLEMLETGWKQAVDKFPWGAGFGEIGIRYKGKYLVIHMTCLQILCDEGLLGLVVYLLFLLFPFYRGIKYLMEKRKEFAARFEVMLTPLPVLSLYLFIGCLHSLSNELTEWTVVLSAISIIMIRVTHRH